MGVGSGRGQTRSLRGDRLYPKASGYFGVVIRREFCLLGGVRKVDRVVVLVKIFPWGFGRWEPIMMNA